MSGKKKKKKEKKVGGLDSTWESNPSSPRRVVRPREGRGKLTCPHGRCPPSSTYIIPTPSSLENTSIKPFGFLSLS